VSIKSSFDLGPLNPNGKPLEANLAERIGLLVVSP
jgi:hypothetical protein